MGREGDKKTGITGSTTEQYAGQVSYDLSHSLLSLLFSVASCQTGLCDRVSGEDGWKEKGAPKSKTFKRQIYVIGFRGNSGYILEGRRFLMLRPIFYPWQISEKHIIAFLP